MELKKNQYVVFEDGHKEGYLEARYSEKHQAFISFVDAEEGGTKKIFSNEIVEKPETKNKKKFIPSATTCTKQIFPCGETEKAYQVEDGTNGLIGRGNRKVYYKYYAKSICYIDEKGQIFAPAWA